MRSVKSLLAILTVCVFFIAGCSVVEEPVSSDLSKERKTAAVPEKVYAGGTEGTAEKEVIDAKAGVKSLSVKADVISGSVEEAAQEVAAEIEETAGETEAAAPDVAEGMPLEPVRQEKKSVVKEGDLLVADFEGWPNNIGGEIGVYGSLEPDWDEMATTPYSWVYEPVTPGYDTVNVHSGRQSFRLVNGLGIKSDVSWGSFAMDMGPTLDVTTMPKKVESLDVSGYDSLVFWAKGKKGGEKLQFIARDSHALNYMPQAKYMLPPLTTEWQKIVIPLDEIENSVDIKSLDNIGLAFGMDVGNGRGETAYLDTFLFRKGE